MDEPTLRDEPLRKGKDLHVVPDSFEGWALKDEATSEPEGYTTNRRKRCQRDDSSRAATA